MRSGLQMIWAAKHYPSLMWISGRQTFTIYDCIIYGGWIRGSGIVGFDRFLMKIMRRVMISGSTKEAGGAANKMKERIDSGVDLVDRANISALVNDAKKRCTS